MKKFFSIFALFTLVALNLNANPVQQNKWGVGVIAGEPTGLSLKNWLSDEHALDAAIAWSFEDNTSLHIHASYLLHDFELLKPERGQMPLYIGAGLRYKARSGKSDRLGIRVPVGIAYHMPNDPIEIFAEVAPIIDLTPGSRIVLSGSIGLRFYFN